jgi:type I restriction-modification system DNA methylase subunit
MVRRPTIMEPQRGLPFSDVSEAERILLDLADFIYGHTALKPMSKTLFFLSRCLLVAESCKEGAGARLAEAYQRVRASLNGSAPEDDFDFSEVVAQCEGHIEYVLDALRRVREITRQTDSLGLVFNTLLRGKCEGGEGLGTYLTPEEVVVPMVDMLLASVDRATIAEFLKPQPRLLYGDICGGTGRFVYALARRLRELHGCSASSVEKAARLYDQSVFAVDCAKLNFVFEGMKPRFHRVDDSLTADHVSALRGKFGLLATNPPFGAGKYRWNARLAKVFPREVLLALGLQGPKDGADPSELFFFRNVELLAPGGALAIIMPDGAIHSERFKAALDAYERIAVPIQIEALVSLPVATFSLGGTVAKTSFLIVRSGETPSGHGVYLAAANHVGFLKRGNRRTVDPAGNDLAAIVQDFSRKPPSLGTRVADWRDYDRLAPSRLFAFQTSPAKQKRLREFAVAVRRTTMPDASSGDSFHVSVLDVDETGLIDVVSASANNPTTPGLACEPGDVLVSCINPRIWRVAVVPEIPGNWTCSGEFLVLRAKPSVNPWALAVALHHRSVLVAVQAMAGGTSSSRQRVPKELLLDVPIPVPSDGGASLQEHAKARIEFYRMRLREARAYGRLHEGAVEFDLG